MPDLSEFVEFVAAKSGIAKPVLVDQDILIHGLLKEFYGSPGFTANRYPEAMGTISMCTT